MWKTVCLVVFLGFTPFLALGTGVNAVITIDSPENITYTVRNILLGVSSNASSVAEWNYSVDGGVNVTFTPNITLNFTDGFHNLTVTANESNASGNLYGTGLYGSGLYGTGDGSFSITSAIVFFTVRAKRFLMEIYITFELMALALMGMGIRRHDKLVYALLSMSLFFSLAVMGFSVEQIADNVAFYSPMAVFFNFGMGMLMLVFVVLNYLGYFQSELTERDDIV